MKNQTQAPAGWTRLPPAARWLGLAGLIPFFGCAVFILLADGPATSQRILGAMLVCGAVILSFLGGVAWGAAMARGEQGLLVYLQAVTPSLVAWLTLLFVYPLHQAFVMALAFALLWLLDRHHQAEDRFPAPYMRLRALLTIGVVVTFLVAGVAILPA